jgi:hypothetical protein
LQTAVTVEYVTACGGGPGRLTKSWAMPGSTLKLGDGHVLGPRHSQHVSPDKAENVDVLVFQVPADIGQILLHVIPSTHRPQSVDLWSLRWQSTKIVRAPTI